MTRRVAGRADGRPNTSAPRTTPTGGGREGGRRLVLGALATVVTGLLGVPGTAHAAPGDPDSSTGSSADRPLELTVSRLEPRTVTPGAAVEVTATLRNDSTETYDDLEVRLQRGEVLTTRSGLAADLSRPGEHTAATTPFVEVPGADELEPGEAVTFSYSTPAEALQLTADGVYPLLFNVNGTRADGVTERAAELATHLVVQPAVSETAPQARTEVAWLWPVTDRPHRDATGAFTDDALAAQVDDGGRLDRILETIEQLPRTTGATAAETVPAVPVTLAVDPALLEELAAMAAGPYLAGGEEGTGTADAAGLLERLRRVAADHDVVALPYADVDADALVAAGEPEALLRALPGAGTVRQPSTADGALVPTPAAGATPTGAGAAVVEEVLGVQPRTDLAWPAGGTVDEGTLTTLGTGGVGTVVLAEDGLTDGSQAVGDDGDPAAARGVLETTGGPVTALVADGELAEAVEAATLRPEAGRLVEQRYLAELAALHAQQADGATSTVLVAPPRWVDPDPGTVAAMMTDTATQPWLAPVSVAALADRPAAEVGELTGTDPDVRLPTATMAGIVETSGVRDDFAAAVVGDADEALAGYDAAIARAASAQRRGDPEALQAAVTDLQGTVARLREQVSLVSPADGTYTLASTDAPLVLTVRNDLPFAVDVRLDLQSRRNVGLVTEDIGVQTLEPESLTTLEVPADVQQSGGFAVTARLTTPAGGPLGEPVQLQVRSTAYGPVTLAITLGAAALLALLFLRRAVRFVLRRRRGEPAPTPDPAAGPPPARSPV
ncbi:MULTISPECIES: DUF6049 family protein [unclassified Modestobacter]|uniref:DUF6049 family protein n=1 Tax=unclassified Modestobacter TaxID=2643866 RepID=UPI0022AB226A|nr:MULTISPECIES: DUF6049 family protein [unclassified Modestobacter]MCZ2823003.1 DUF6049 family protein [Modestobacter sp. VKM Ac-2981]MCZ2851249.1 DUF6049 family protein [Modestobacter sp. VKM Ac-2982]